MNETTGLAPEAGLEQLAGDNVLAFPEGLPGFETLRAWQLVVHDEARPFLWLRAADRAGLSLVLIEPREIEPEYAVSFSRAELARIGLAPGDPCLMLAVVTLGQDGATVNLRAPLVLNPERMCGAQIILDDATWPLRRPLDADGSR